jgi:hypothetical protein
MTTEQGNQGQYTTRKTTVIGPAGHPDGVVFRVDTHYGESEVIKETITQLGQCGSCHQAIKAEAEIGGICSICGLILCTNCCQRKCVHGCCVCDECSMRIGNVIYCRRHGIQELIGRFLAFLIAAAILLCLGVLVWRLAS